MVDGIGRAEIDRLENHDPSQAVKGLRPRDAGTLILVDGAKGNWRVLMGKRHMRHVFMPGKFVFPGGRVDPDDGDIPSVDELRPSDREKLMAGMGARASRRRARALALAAVRETYEEAGIFLGRPGHFVSGHRDWSAFSERDIVPCLSAIRYVARAITPPGRKRRFDTRFFMAHASTIASTLPEGTGPSGELEGVRWMSFDEAQGTDIPSITRTMLDMALRRLGADPDLDGEAPVPCFSMRGNTFRRIDL